MAEFLRPQLSITLRDGVFRDSVVSYFISDADMQEYTTAADDTERAASKAGVLIAATIAMSDMAFVQSSVGLTVINDPVTNPADTVLRGNKLTFALRSGGRGLTQTLPGRKAAAYSQNTDSLQVSLTTPAAMAAWVAAVEDTATDAFGNAIDITRGEVVD